MKKVFTALFIISLGAISNAQSSKDNEEIINVANSFFNSWNRHDFSDMKNYTSDDFSIVINAGVLWKGRDQVQKAHENAHKTLMKATSFTPDQQTISTRLITPDVAAVNMVAGMGAYYPPDGIDRGNNKMGDGRVMLTMIEVRKNGKWLLSAAQGTDINPDAEKALQH